MCSQVYPPDTASLCSQVYPPDTAKVPERQPRIQVSSGARGRPGGLPRPSPEPRPHPTGAPPEDKRVQERGRPARPGPARAAGREGSGVGGEREAEGRRGIADHFVVLFVNQSPSARPAVRPTPGIGLGRCHSPSGPRPLSSCVPAFVLASEVLSGGGTRRQMGRIAPSLVPRRATLQRRLARPWLAERSVWKKKKLFGLHPTFTWLPTSEMITAYKTSFNK
ncbi:uncharacterized protein [Notamacropus eugenii]|uniref:uncharacterized protein n=1 Tax=Notamacropus eugenii TaxID=9315 RepID=UPI003B68282D